jgi:NhaA family Na+:H+ antiporter
MKIIEDFISNESSSGILLIFVTILALLISNSTFAPFYSAFLSIPIEVRFGALDIAKPLYLWVNDGLMAIFFLLIGLEVKREIIEGHLSSLNKIALPGIAAIGGMAVPAAIYAFFNLHDDTAISGWAIPTATDIAFALGILSLLGKRVPISLKIFLMALAIIDDLGAIIIISIFYTSQLSLLSITIAGAALVVLIGLNYYGVTKKAAYFIVGTVMWISVLKSGVHATLAGVMLAFTIPLSGKNEYGKKVFPAKELEYNLHFWVAFMILPIFAFVNAGINITEISLDQMAGTVPMGILLGLFVGKQLGVFGFSWLAIKLKIASIPKDSTWLQLYGVSVLTGIGFTMSLFIGTLAFEDDSLYQFTDKLAILIASFAAGIIGYFILKTSNPNNKVKSHA